MNAYSKITSPAQRAATHVSLLVEDLFSKMETKGVINPGDKWSTRFIINFEKNQMLVILPGGEQKTLEEIQQLIK